MAVEDDPAWAEWSAAHDAYVRAYDAFVALSANDPQKAQAWAVVRFAERALEAAANKIDPRFPDSMFKPGS